MRRPPCILAVVLAMSLARSGRGESAATRTDADEQVRREARNQVMAELQDCPSLGGLSSDNVFQLDVTNGMLELTSPLPQDPHARTFGFSDLPGIGRIDYGFGPGRRLANVMPLSINIYNFDDPTFVFVHTQMAMAQFHLQISYDMETSDEKIRSVQLIQSTRPDDPERGITLYVQDDLRFADGRSFRFRGMAADAVQLVQSHPDEAQRYIRPLFQSLHRRTQLFSISPAVARQVLDETALPASVVNAIEQAVAKLGADSYEQRERGLAELQAIGLPAAMHLARHMPASLSLEQSTRIAEFLKEAHALSEDQISHDRLNLTFLIDCLTCDDDSVPRWPFISWRFSPANIGVLMPRLLRCSGMSAPKRFAAPCFQPPSRPERVRFQALSTARVSWLVEMSMPKRKSRLFAWPFLAMLVLVSTKPHAAWSQTLPSDPTPIEQLEVEHHLLSARYDANVQRTTLRPEELVRFTFSGQDLVADSRLKTLPPLAFKLLGLGGVGSIVKIVVNGQPNPALDVVYFVDQPQRGELKISLTTATDRLFLSSLLVQGDGRVCQVDLSQIRSSLTNGVFLHIHDERGRDPVSLDFKVKNVSELMHDHCLVMLHYVKPVFDHLKAHSPLFGVDADEARSMLSTLQTPDEQQVARIMQIIPNLADDSYEQRQSAMAQLQAMGPAAAIYLANRFDRNWPPEEAMRIDAFVASFRLKTESADRDLRNPSFLIDCLRCVDLQVVSLALAQLELIEGKHIRFDCTAGLESRYAAVESLISARTAAALPQPVDTMQEFFLVPQDDR